MWDSALNLHRLGWWMVGIALVAVAVRVLLGVCCARFLADRPDDDDEVRG